MPMLDVFKEDIFGVVSLTAAINKLPYVPSRLGSMNLFKTKGVATTTVLIEEQFGKLMIVPTAARGTNPNVMGGRTRRAKAFAIPHVPLVTGVMADDVQGVRAFGEESEVEVASTLVNDKMAEMRQAMEVTHEWHRIGAIQGIVLDADGSAVIYDWFDEFGITEEVLPVDFTDVNAVKLASHAVSRHIEDSLGITPYTRIRAMCGATFFDSLTTSASVKEAYDRFQESSFFRESHARKEFEFAGIVWEEYRGSVGNAKFIDDNSCRIFPEGVNDLFITTFGPADWMETVNTQGKPVYAKQKPKEWDLGIDLAVQSNPLVMCTRPSVLIRIYDEAVGSA